MQYGTNKARFGLFFSDMVDSSLNIKSTSSVFDSHNTFGETSQYIDNPFLMSLLERPESIDELEKKWARSYHQNSESGVFSGHTNEFGMKMIDDDAFFSLNEPGGKTYDEDDGLFGSSMREFNDDDDDVGFF